MLIKNKIWFQIKKNARYLLIFFIFIFVLTTGKNLTQEPTDDSLVNIVENLTKLEQGIYEISESESSLKIDDIGQLNRGDSFRIWFDLDFGNNVSNHSDSMINLGSRDYGLDISLLNIYGDKKLLRTIDFKRNSNNKTIEIVGIADNRYSNLLFEKRDIDYSGVIKISNFRINRLNVINESLLNQLKTSISGATDKDQIILESPSTKVGGGYDLDGGGGTIGQVFTAEDELVSAINLKIETIGSGGLGNYYLELREIEENGDTIKLSSQRLTYYFFSAEDLNELRYGSNSYHFPIGAKLKKGQKYFIGINTEAAQSNIFNCLKIFDSGPETSNSYGLRSKNGKSEKINNLYFQLYGAKYTYFGGELVLSGATIEDFGQGEGRYRYAATGSVTDFLDLFSVKSSTGSPIVYYDNVQRGISGKAQNNTEFIYKFDTVYPFRKMNIALSCYSGEAYESLLSYSYDNENWHQLDFEADQFTLKKKNTLNQSIDGGDQISQVFIRVTYNPDSPETSIDLFGINDIEINADLIVNK